MIVGADFNMTATTLWSAGSLQQARMKPLTTDRPTCTTAISESTIDYFVMTTTMLEEVVDIDVDEEHHHPPHVAIRLELQRGGVMKKKFELPS